MRFSDRLKALFGKATADRESFFDELADLLVEGDLGATLAFQIADELRDACRKAGIREPQATRLELKRILLSYCRSASIVPENGKMNIFLLLGVNGVGKTTSCAKLARYYASRGMARDIILAAGDTFRAAAIDQLKVHGKRLGYRVVAQAPGSDPGAVLFDAIDAAKAQGSDLVIADSAGRMHTRQDLIRELGKMDKIVGSRAEGASYRRLLVLDATTGQNGLRQAEAFKGGRARGWRHPDKDGFLGQGRTRHRPRQGTGYPPRPLSGRARAMTTSRPSMRTPSLTISSASARPLARRPAIRNGTDVVPARLLRLSLAFFLVAMSGGRGNTGGSRTVLLFGRGRIPGAFPGRPWQCGLCARGDGFGEPDR